MKCNICNESVPVGYEGDVMGLVDHVNDDHQDEILEMIVEQFGNEHCSSCKTKGNLTKCNCCKCEARRRKGLNNYKNLNK